MQLSRFKSPNFIKFDYSILFATFGCLNKSEQFKKLPENFPYHHLVKDLRDKLKVICIENENSEEVPLKLNRRLKTELIVYRCELRTVVSKVKFSELNFKTNKDG